MRPNLLVVVLGSIKAVVSRLDFLLEKPGTPSGLIFLLKLEFGDTQLSFCSCRSVLSFGLLSCTLVLRALKVLSGDYGNNFGLFILFSDIKSMLN